MKNKAQTKEPKQRMAFLNNYRAAVLAVAALLISFVASAQTDSLKYSQINGYGFKYKRHVQDSVSIIPLSTSPHTPYRAGGIRYRSSDSTLQLWTGYQWNSIVTGVGNGVDTAYALNDSIIAIETPDQDFFVKIPGRYWDLQGVLNNGSVLTDNETITLLDSLKFLSGLVVVETLRISSLTSSTDTALYKALVTDASGNVSKMSSWPGAPLNLQQVTDNGHKTTDTIVAGGLRTRDILTDTSDLDDYEIDVFPDLQVESYQGADTAVLGSMFNWVVNNRNTENIKAVLQVGDLTQDATASQFTRIDSNYDKFDAMPAPQLPYLAVPGNHDFDGGGVSGGRFFTVYNTYMGPNRFSGKTFYGHSLNGSNDNYYIKFKAGADSILVLGLEFLPRTTTLTWAQSVLDSFPSYKVMVVTHAHITAYGEKAMDTSKFSTNWYGMVADNDGQDVWNNFIRRNKQIAFVFNGHYISVTTSAAQALANTNLGLPAVKQITQAGLNGNTVYQILCNYQTDSLGGNGYFMRMKFKPRTGKVVVSFYSAYLNRYDARFPSYTLDYPGLNVSAVVGVSGINGGLTVGGAATFDSTVFISQIPKNRLFAAGKNGQVDTVFNDVADKVLVSNGVHEKPSFKTLAVSQIPLDSGKNILNQLTNPQTANFWVKGKGIIGTHSNYPTILAGLTTQFVVTTGSANWGPVSARAAGAGSGGAKWNFYTTRGADFNTPVAVAVGDALGELNWFGTANDLVGRRGMYLRGYTYAIGSNYVSVGFDFRNVNLAGTDIQTMHVHPDGHTVIGPGAVSLIDRLKVDGTLLVTDTVKTPNIASKFDTTNYKPIVVDASGNHFKSSFWPITSPTVTTLYTGDGNLTGSRIVTGDANSLTLTSTNTTGANSTLTVNNTSTGRGVTVSSGSGTGVRSVATSGYGVQGISTSNYGLRGESSSASGLYAISSAVHGGEIVTNPTSTNTVTSILNLQRISQSAGANGIGGSINFYINNTASAGNAVLANQLISKLTTATATSEVSQLEFWGLNGGTAARKLAIAGNGQLTADGYGSGTFTGTPATTPVYTSTGTIVERVAPKIYTALLSQSGTSDPTVIILGTNEIGTIVWTRNSAGNYTGTLSGAFTADKTWAICQKGDMSGSFVNGLLSRGGANTVTLDVRDNAAAVTDNFTNMSIEIRVYP
jgi:hypothetical protein